MRLHFPRRTWRCVDGPNAGAWWPVSRLAAWTGCTETRIAVVQRFGERRTRLAGTDARGRAALRTGEIVVGYYGARPFDWTFTFEPSRIAHRWDDLARDHRTPLGWMERVAGVSGASWNYGRVHLTEDHHFGRRA